MADVRKSEIYFGCTSQLPQAIVVIRESYHMPGSRNPLELSQREPLISLYRARDFISEPDVRELLDSLIVLVTKRMMKPARASRRIDGSELPAVDITDPIIRQCLESPPILSVEELAALLRLQLRKTNGTDDVDKKHGGVTP
jgi:hypothetical protein